MEFVEFLWIRTSKQPDAIIIITTIVVIMLDLNSKNDFGSNIIIIIAVIVSNYLRLFQFI